MARLVQQHPSARSVYEIGVDAIENARRNEVREASEERYGSSLLGQLLTDFTVVQHNLREQSHTEKGEIGEYHVTRALLERLPDDWALFTPFVLFPRPGDYAQIDHLLIGPPGFFIIETKAWQGSFLGKRDAWSRRVADKWVPCESPTHQISRHLYWLQQWLERQKHPDLPANLMQLVEALVVFTEAKWVKANACAFQVYEGVQTALDTLVLDSRRRLTPAQIVHLVTYMTAPPLPIHKSAVRPTAAATAPSPEIPTCPLCKVLMVKRTAKKGDNKGQPFWGCTRYPNCRQILPV